MIGVAVLVTVALAMATPPAVVAEPKCKKAARVAVDLIEGGAFTLEGARQVKAPAGDVDTHGRWLIAGRITGGAGDGQVGTWARIKLRPQADGILIALDDGAKAATPELGADVDPYAFTNPSSAAYDRVVACASR